jgi:SsrA-binding protein
VSYNRLMAPKKPESQDSQHTTVARNRRARHEYEILEEIECGIVLVGSEVKSIRNGKISIEEAYARVYNGELWLIDCDIAEYPQANVMNHVAKRTRKLLLRKRELEKVAEAATHKGLTLVPLAIYFSRGFVKVKVAVARGRKMHDKREQLRQKEDAREMRNAALRRR